jgi:hypothetical protein
MSPFGGVAKSADGTGRDAVSSASGRAPKACRHKKQRPKRKTSKVVKLSTPNSDEEYESLLGKASKNQLRDVGAEARVTDAMRLSQT